MPRCPLISRPRLSGRSVMLSSRTATRVSTWSAAKPAAARRSVLAGTAGRTSSRRRQPGSPRSTSGPSHRAGRGIPAAGCRPSPDRRRPQVQRLRGINRGPGGVSQDLPIGQHGTISGSAFVDIPLTTSGNPASCFGEISIRRYCSVVGVSSGSPDGWRPRRPVRDRPGRRPAAAPATAAAPASRGPAGARGLAERRARIRPPGAVGPRRPASRVRTAPPSPAGARPAAWPARPGTAHPRYTAWSARQRLLVHRPQYPDCGSC